MREMRNYLRVTSFAVQPQVVLKVKHDNNIEDR